MKVETMTAHGAAFGSASVAAERPPEAEAHDPAVIAARRGRPDSASEAAAQDFVLAMRRVEAECYDTL